MLLAGQQYYHLRYLTKNLFYLTGNEIELDRNDAYTEQQFGRNGVNGGLTIARKFYPRWKASVTWRYFDNKLGYDGFGDQMIYMLGYDF